MPGPLNTLIGFATTSAKKALNGTGARATSSLVSASTFLRSRLNLNAQIDTSGLAASRISSMGTSEVNLATHSSANSPAHSPEIAKAAEAAAKAIGIADFVSPTVPVSPKLAMSVSDPMSALAALFSLFMPRDIEQRARYISAVGFAYNQTFADTVEHLNEMLSREIHVERLSVAKHACAKLKNQLAPDASRRVLLNIERLLKAQGLHDLMNYSAVQYLRQELAAEFPVLNATADENEPDAAGGLLKPVDEMGEEFSRLISSVLSSTDLDRATVNNEYARVMALYANADYPRCDDNELLNAAETEAAFQLLLMQPHGIRETFVKHCKAIFDLDEEDAQPKRSQFALLCAALGCSSEHENHWRDDSYVRKLA